MLHDAMLSLADGLGMPIRFRTDLEVHDKAFAATHDVSKPFVYAIGENGTVTARNRRDGGFYANGTTYARTIKDFAPYTYIWRDGAFHSATEVEIAEFLA